MNYRHAYHAGNFADVFKHIITSSIVTYLKLKHKPFHIIDTHAGTGLTDLTGIEATRTGEFRDGILRLLAETEVPTALAPYLDAVRAFGPDCYPGSPCLFRKLIRPEDRLIAAELHPDDAATLAALFRHDRSAAIHHMDGYQALKAFLPPPSRRGLVLIDPPFEAPDEFTRLAEGLHTAHSRWPDGVYAAWYPIKAAATPFHAELRRSGMTKILIAELLVQPICPLPRLAGCGLVVINPPWTLEDSLREILPFLCRVLAREPGGDWRLMRLA